MIHLILFATLLLAESQAQPVGPSAEGTSRLWLTAFAGRDSVTIRQLSAFPLVVDGFQFNERPEKNPCDRVPGMSRDPRTREIRVSAATEAEFDTVIACVLSDSARDEWTNQPGGGGGFKGTVRVLKNPAQASYRLARYRKQTVPLTKTRTFVEALTTDSGVTVAALLVLRPGTAGALTVEAVHFDFRFEE